MNNKISFDSWENEKPHTIQLEPEASSFSISNTSRLTLIAKKTNSNFYWHFKSSVESDGCICTQVYPEGDFSEIEAYENDERIY